MTPLRIVVADDEDLARSLVREYLKDSLDVQIVAECKNGFEAVKAVTELKPDLLLLDIQMPRLDGFEVLDLVGRNECHFHHGLRSVRDSCIRRPCGGLSAQALQYRTASRSNRPCDEEDRAGRIHRSSNVVGGGSGSRRKPDRILIRDGGDVHVIPLVKIDYVEAQDDYVCYRAEGKRYLKQQTLADVETALDPSRFVRIHRSYILNVDRLAKLELYAKDSHAAILRDGTRLPVSRSGYARLNAMIG